MQNFFNKIVSTIMAFFMLFVSISWTDYSDLIKQGVKLPGLADGFIPQGMCFVEDLGMFAVSGYHKDGEQNSQIFLVNPQTGETKEYEIDKFTYHAGGIASDGENIWVSSRGSAETNGYVYRFSTDKFKGEDKKAVKYDGCFQVPVKGSTLYCDGEKLWVGEFYEFSKESNRTNLSHFKGINHAWACGYDLSVDIDYSGKEVVPEVVLSIPDKVQGMSVAGNGEVIFSTSYGRDKDSKMLIFTNYENWDSKTVKVFGEEVPIYISRIKDRVKKITMPTLMEGMDYYNGSLYVIFESGANEYSDAKEINKNMWEMDIDSIIKV